MDMSETSPFPLVSTGHVYAGDYLGSTKTAVQFDSIRVDSGVLRATNFNPNHSSIVFAEGDARVFAYGNITVYATGDAIVHVFKGAVLIAAESAKGRAYEFGEVVAMDQAEVIAHDRRSVTATGSSTVTGHDNVLVTALDMTTTHLFGESRGVMRGLAAAVTHDMSETHLFANTHAEIHGGTVILHESSKADLHAAGAEIDEELGGVRFDGGHVYALNANALTIVAPETDNEQEIEEENRQMIDEVIPVQEDSADGAVAEVSEEVVEETSEEPEGGFTLDEVVEEAATDVVEPEGGFTLDEVATLVKDARPAQFNYSLPGDDEESVTPPSSGGLSPSPAAPADSHDPNGYLTLQRVGDPTTRGEEGRPTRNEHLNYGLGASTDPASPVADVDNDLAVPQLEALGWEVLSPPTGAYQPFETMSDEELKRRTTASGEEKPATEQKEKRAGFSF